VLAGSSSDRKTGVRPTCSAEVVGSEVIRGLVVEVVHEPTVSERTVGYVGNVEFTSGVEEAVGLVQGLEGRVFGLDGVNLGDCKCVSDRCIKLWRSSCVRTYSNWLCEASWQSTRIVRCTLSFLLCG